MEPAYFYLKQGTGSTTDFLIIDTVSDQIVYRFVAPTQTSDNRNWKKGCGLGCLGVIIAFFIGAGDVLNFGGNTTSPRQWEFRRENGHAVFTVRKIRRGLDILENGESIGRIEWKKRKKIVDHEVILDGRLLALAVPNGIMRNEVSLEVPSGNLAVLRQTQALTNKKFGEIYLKKELPEKELGMIFAVGLLWA